VVEKDKTTKPPRAQRIHKGHGEKFLTENEMANKVIGIAIDVHKALGPGLLESAYMESND